MAKTSGRITTIREPFRSRKPEAKWVSDASLLGNMTNGAGKKVGSRQGKSSDKVSKVKRSDPRQNGSYKLSAYESSGVLFFSDGALSARK